MLLLMMYFLQTGDMTILTAKEQRHLRQLITFRHKFGSDKSDAEETKVSADQAQSKSPRPVKKSFSEMTLSDIVPADDNENTSPTHSSSSKSPFSATPDETMRQVNQARNRLVRPRAARGERTRHLLNGPRAAITRKVMKAMKKVGRSVTNERSSERNTSMGRQDRSGVSFYQRQQQDVPLERPKASHGRPKPSNVPTLPFNTRDLPPLPRPCW